MTFQQATQEDAKEILILYRAAIGSDGCTWSMDYPSEETIAFDMKRDALFCIKDGNEIVGAISQDMDEAVEALTCWSPHLKPAGELSRLVVKEGYQNQGIAKELLKGGMNVLKERGYQGVHFLVCKNHNKAINAYKKLEFTRVGECELFGHPFWCYEKML